jgi:hypothetical protein
MTHQRTLVLETGVVMTLFSCTLRHVRTRMRSRFHALERLRTNLHRGPHSPLINAIPTPSISAPPLTSLAPAAARGMQPLALSAQPATPQPMHMHAPQQQQQQFQQQPPQQQHQQPPQPPPQAPASAGGGGGGGVLSGVGSFLGSMFGSTPVRQVNLEEHQGAEHYYDETRGRWVLFFSHFFSNPCIS